MSDEALRARALGAPIYPLQAERAARTGDRYGAIIEGVFRRRLRPSPDHAFCSQVVREEAAVRDLSDAQLGGLAARSRRAVRSHGDDATLARSFALVREASRRVLGLRHHDVQILGAKALMDGQVAEMATGEGKTITAGLAACAAALRGERVHVVTVNDYLAKRDRDIVAPLLDFLQVTSGAITHELDPDERRRVYRTDVAYCSNKEVAFDFLRDRLILAERDGATDAHLRLERLTSEARRADRLVLHGLPFAIVDEADSVLIDEARTPLILSGPAPTSPLDEMTVDALRIARSLLQNEHYTLDLDRRQVALTDAGHAALDNEASGLGGHWRIGLLREEAVIGALTALHLFRRGDDYVVRDGKVQIVDENTGRIMADRQWRAGQHQFVEEKEGVARTPPTVTLAELTYQRLFRRYRRLAGMTGTGVEVAGELWSVYGLPVVTVPTHAPSRRTIAAPRVFTTEAEKFDHATRRAAGLAAGGLPVLIGTRTVTASETLAERLKAAGLKPQVLNADREAEEAELVARAGEPGRVTVATNMAGRGTDIALAEGVAERGGLHVILTELHEARRIDRQLVGRCARQGEPGHAEVLMSLEDELLAPLRTSARGRLMIAAARRAGSRNLVRLFRRAQRRRERLHARIRAALLGHDERVGKALAFSGRPE